MAAFYTSVGQTTRLITNTVLFSGALDFEHIEEQAEGIFGGR